jgi:serine/threonine protein kinase
MGKVYEAEVEGIGSRVAVKVLHRSDALDAREQRLRFTREAEILTQLRHPNIVRMLDFTEAADGKMFLVMELVGGENLRDLLLVEGHLLEPRLVPIARQIAEALGEAHRHGIVHRDLKPANVHVVTGESGRERVVVLDFGVGKQLDEDTDQQLTGLGRYIGSMPYSSPEQLLTGPLDGRSDIYSLGVSLFEMATGLVPFVASSPMDLVDMHLHQDVPAFHKVFPACRVSPRIEAIVRRCLAKSPADRWQTAHELSAALGATWPEAPTKPR